jgi:hypothetical protein
MQKMVDYCDGMLMRLDTRYGGMLGSKVGTLEPIRGLWRSYAYRPPWLARVGAFTSTYNPLPLPLPIKSTSEYTRNSSAELKMYRSWLDIPLHSVGPTQMVLP